MEDKANMFPVAKTVVDRDMYMDDLICSLPDNSSAMKTYEEIVYFSLEDSA